MNKKRFDEEFLEEKDEDGKPLPPKKSNKPEDYEAVFTGNIDDSFRIGISVSKRTLRVFQLSVNHQLRLICLLISFIRAFTCLTSW